MGTKRHLPIAEAARYSMDGKWGVLWDELFPKSRYVLWSWGGQEKIEDRSVAHLRRHLKDSYSWLHANGNARLMDIIKLKIHLRHFKEVAKVGGASASRMGELHKKGLRILMRRLLNYEESPTLESLNLSVRTINALQRADLFSLPLDQALEAIQNMSTQELLKIKNFGTTSLRELDQRLEELGRPRHQIEEVVRKERRPPEKPMTEKTALTYLNRLLYHFTKEQVAKLVDEALQERIAKELYVPET